MPRSKELAKFEGFSASRWATMGVLLTPFQLEDDIYALCLNQGQANAYYGVSLQILFDKWGAHADFQAIFDSFNDRLELKGTATSLSPVLKWLRHFRGVSKYNNYASGNNYFRIGYRSSVAEPLLKQCTRC